MPQSYPEGSSLRGMVPKEMRADGAVVSLVKVANQKAQCDYGLGSILPSIPHFVTTEPSHGQGERET